MKKKKVGKSDGTINIVTQSKKNATKAEDRWRSWKSVYSKQFTKQLLNKVFGAKVSQTRPIMLKTESVHKDHAA